MVLSLVQLAPGSPMLTKHHFIFLFFCVSTWLHSPDSNFTSIRENGHWQQTYNPDIQSQKKKFFSLTILTYFFSRENWSHFELHSNCWVSCTLSHRLSFASNQGSGDLSQWMCVWQVRGGGGHRFTDSSGPSGMGEEFPRQRCYYHQKERGSKKPEESKLSCNSPLESTLWLLRRKHLLLSTHKIPNCHLPKLCFDLI